MSSGKATGNSLIYQQQCAAWLQKLENVPLVPYCGDGIDVPFTMGGTTWRIDVALRYQNGGIVAAECKRYRLKHRVIQDEIAAFAYKLILLRELTHTAVAGYFFANGGYQQGAVLAAHAVGIKPYTIDYNHDTVSFAATYEEFVDVGRQKKRRRPVYGFVTIRGGAGGSVHATVSDGQSIVNTATLSLDNGV